MGDHQELVLQQNITHWSHMEDIEWSSSSRWGVMSANNGWVFKRFGHQMLKNFCQIQPKKWHDLAWQICVITRSSFNNKTSLIGHVWRTLNGPAAADEVP
jgi:hypothetical protein